MGSGYHGGFGNTGGSSASGGSINGKNYNPSGSSSVKKVTSLSTTTSHSMPVTGEPNSVTQKISSNGKVTSERYFDSKGYPYLDIDYTDHGNPKTHPNVPHEHTIQYNNGTITREK